MKILISGAGIAGPTLAYWLRRCGHEPTLVEKAPTFRTGGYIIDFWGVGYAIAEKMGILPEIREAGYRLQEVRIVDDEGQRTGGFSADVFRQMTEGRFTSLPRGDLATAIFGSIENDVETVFGDSITAIDESSDGVYVEFEHHQGHVFDLVIGADGLHSKVRELVFGPEDRFEMQLGYHVAAFQVAGYEPRDGLTYVGHAVPGRQLARFALRDDRTMFLLVFDDSHMSGQAPRRIDERKVLLHRVFSDAGWESQAILGAMDGVDDIYFDRVSQIKMNHWSQGRVMLIGDAAACVSLLAGEGTGLAMTEAYVLAGELQAAGGDHRTAFAAHESRVRPFIEKKQKSAQEFASSFAPKTSVGVWTRNQATKLLGLPLVARLLLGREMQDEIDLPEYAM